MDPMMKIPAHRSRPPRWRIPLLIALGVVFLVCLWAVAAPQAATLGLLPF